MIVDCKPLLSLIAAMACLPAPAADIPWRNIGPGGGGWMTCLTVDPKDPDTVYAGCDVGGFYKSTDAGAHWTISNAGLTADYVQQIVVHPSNTQTIYAAGCGGVFRSDNGGATWRWLRRGFPKPSASRYGAPVGALAMDRDDPQVLYAGIGFPRKWAEGNGLVYKTTDGGETWVPRTGIQALAAEACFAAIVIRPGRPGTLLAASDKGLFRSENGAETWQQVGRGLPGLHVTDVAFCAARPEVVYATVWTRPGERPWRGGVYRSDDGGTTFSARTEGLPHAVGKPGASPNLTCNFLKVAVAPNDPNVVYAGSSAWVGAGLFRSADGGTHWEMVTRRGAGGNVDDGWITMGGTPGIKCLAISPHNPARIYVGTSMHVFRTDDGGGHWRPCFTEQARPGWWSGNGLETTCLSHITVDPTCGRRVYFGYADVGLLASEDGGESFQRRVEGIPWHGDQAPVAVDPRRPEVLWCGKGKARVPGGGVAKSTDFGRTWTVVGQPETGLPEENTARLVLDPSSPLGRRTLYVTSAGHGIYKSEDDGASWQPANEGLGQGGGAQVTWIVLDPQKPLRVYATLRHTDKDPLGGVYRSEDGGKNWGKINRGSEFPDPFCLAVDPRRPEVLFVAARGYYDRRGRRRYPGGVFRSIDGGATWAHVIENRFAACVLVSPRDSRTVYAALTDHPYHDNCLGGGVMRSSDGGLTWRAENEGLSVTQVDTIVCDPTDPAVLYIGTGGNGVFKGVDAGVER